MSRAELARQAATDAAAKYRDRGMSMRNLADEIIDAYLTTLEGDAQPVAWTGSGSLNALGGGGEGYIWPTRADAHPIPLYATPPSPKLGVAVEALRATRRQLLAEHGEYEPQDFRCKTCRAIRTVDAALSQLEKPGE